MGGGLVSAGAVPGVLQQAFPGDAAPLGADGDGFCRQTALTRDAVRRYVKPGLFAPEAGAHASNRYRQFGQAELDRAGVIRTAPAGLHPQADRRTPF